MNEKEFFYFWLHLLVVILVWLSPFYLNWKLILLFVVIYYLQLFVFKGCILSINQFKTKRQRGKNKTFFPFLANKIGIKVKKEKRILFEFNGAIIFVSDVVLPFLLVIIALIYQIFL